MAVNIVTGMTGIEHITSHDDRARNASQFGRGKYVFDIGRKFSATAVDDNLVRIQDGMCINQGTQMGIEPNDYADVEIDNGLLGTNRHDIIVMRYEKNEETLLEKASLAVVKGVNSSEPVDPDITEGNILDGGDLVDDMPLYRVVIEGVNLVSIEPLFEVFDGDVGSILKELEDKVDKITGKGLSTNDYTNEDKEDVAKIDTLETNQTQILSDIEDLEQSLSTTSTATGNPISISNSAHVNAEGLVVTLEPIQSGSGDPSPENIRPISGYDSTSVMRSGKNLLPIFSGEKTNNEITVKSKNGYFIANGTAENQWDCSWNPNITLPAGRYICSLATNSILDVYMSTSNGYKGFTKTGTELVLDEPETITYIFIRFHPGTVYYNAEIKVMIRLATETDSTYEPYTADTYTLQFGETVYGAEVDFVNVVATVTKGYIAEYAGETLPSTWISDRDVYASGTTPTTGAEVVYELATPYTIQLTPQQIKMLKGNNVLAADGEMSLEYQADSVVGNVKEWAENEFLPKASETAQHNYSTQEQVVGTWIDGSTLYEKTIDLGSDISIVNSSWYDTGVDIEDIDMIVSILSVNGSGSFYSLNAYHNADTLNLLASRVNANASVRYITIQYTKTED